jgi:hypothetical protein
MSLQQMIVQAVEELPPAKQQEVLDFAQFLASKNGTKKPLRSLKGLWADLNINISSEDIDEARREMWGNFPREDIV